MGVEVLPPKKLRISVGMLGKRYWYDEAIQRGHWYWESALQNYKKTSMVL
jgi:hypothetical protein